MLPAIIHHLACGHSLTVARNNYFLQIYFKQQWLTINLKTQQGYVEYTSDCIAKEFSIAADVLADLLTLVSNLE